MPWTDQLCNQRGRRLWQQLRSSHLYSTTQEQSLNRKITGCWKPLAMEGGFCPFTLDVLT